MTPNVKVHSALPYPSDLLSETSTAVEYSPVSPLQILAGPGSGKTKVRIDISDIITRPITAI